MTIQTFAQAEAALNPYIPIVQQMAGKSITLERMKPLMERLGNPQEKLQVIHVAGTSGKTSTAYYIASLLGQAGSKVGLTVSPHIETIAERLQINLFPVSEALFCSELEVFLSLIDNVEPQPSYYELLMAFAYWSFARQQVDYAVVETGMGGLHDASNICQRADKICVLTDIGLDHTHVLGSSLAEISAQKAGIMHCGNHAFALSQPFPVIEVIREYAAQTGAVFEVTDEVAERDHLPSGTTLDTLPIFQQRNWLLAHRVYRYLHESRGVAHLDAEELNSSQRVQVPGRMERVQVGDEKAVILDGAHNEQKMKALVESFRQRYPNRKVPVLLAMKTSKKYKAFLRELKPITNELIVTTVPRNATSSSHGTDTDELVSEAKMVGFHDVYVESDTEKAFQQLQNASSDLSLVTGSFYLVAFIRKLL